jgi:hypothetical protein
MSNQKRIIFILGGKGGTGKTLYCLMLYYFLVSSGIKVAGVDVDIENVQFAKYHTNSSSPVHTIDFLDKGEAKNLFTFLEQEQPDVVLVDMPGASGQDTRDQFDYFGVFDILQMLGYRMTINTVMNNRYDSISSFLAMMKHCEDQVDYVVVKNQIFAQGILNFNRWESSATRKELLSLKGIEIEMPVFDPSTADEMEEQTLSFLDKEKLTFGDRILVDSFLNRSRAELIKAAAYLGLPWEGEPEVKRSKNRSKKASSSKVEISEETADSIATQDIVEVNSGS